MTGFSPYNSVTGKAFKMYEVNVALPQDVV